MEQQQILAKKKKKNEGDRKKENTRRTALHLMFSFERVRVRFQIAYFQRKEGVVQGAASSSIRCSSLW
jgi:hypothetical protein